MAMVAKKPHIHIENYFGGKFMQHPKWFFYWF